MRKSIHIPNLIILLGLFCIIYNPPILSINSMHVVGVASLAYLLSRSRRLIIRKTVRFIYSGFIISLLYLGLVFVVSSTRDITILLNPIYFLVDVLPFGFAVKAYCDDKGYGFEDYFYLFIYIALVQAVIAFAALLFPAFQSFLMGRYEAYGYRDVYSRISAFRMYGFSGGLTFATPIFQSFMAIVTLYFAIIKKKPSLYIFALLFSISGIINARTSLIILLVGVATLIITSNISIKNKLLLIVVEISIIFVFISILLPILQRVSPLSYEWITTGINEIVSFFQGNRNQGYFTYISSSNSWPIPPNAFNTIFGTGHDIFGRVSQQKWGVSTDVGYINDLWKGGIVYMVIYYMLYAKLLNRLRKNLRGLTEFIALFCMLTLPLLMIKGPACNMCDMSNAIFLIFIFSSSDKGTVGSNIDC